MKSSALQNMLQVIVSRYTMDLVGLFKKILKKINNWQLLVPVLYLIQDVITALLDSYKDSATPADGIKSLNQHQFAKRTAEVKAAWSSVSWDDIGATDEELKMAKKLLDESIADMLKEFGVDIPAPPDDN